MKRFILLALKYPAEIILSLAFASFFFRYPEIAMANLFMLLALVLSYYLLFSANRYAGYFSILPMIIGMACYKFLPENYNYIYVSGSVILSLGLVLVSLRFGINQKQGKNIAKIFTLGLAIMVLMPLTFNLGTAIFSRSEKAKMIQAAGEVEQQISEKIGKLNLIAPEIAKDQFVIDLLGKSSYQDLAGYLQNLMLTKDLSYLVVLNKDGTVVARAHQTKMVGDDYKGLAVASTEENEFHGVYQEYGRGFLAVSQKISIGGESIGRIVCGNFLDADTAFAGLLDDVGYGIIRQNETLASFSHDQEMALSIKQVAKSDADFLSLMQIRDQKGRIQLGRHHSNIYDIDVWAGRRDDNYSKIYLVNLLFYIAAIIVAVVWIRKNLASEFRTLPSRRNLFRKSKSRFHFDANNVLIIAEIICLGLFGYVISTKTVPLFSQGTEMIKAGDESAQMSFKPHLRLDLSPYAKLSEAHNIRLMAEDLPEGSTTIRATINYQPQYFIGGGIDYQGGLCDRVFDKSIDESSGIINFSCVLKYSDSQTLAGQLAEIKLVPKAIGLASVAIDRSYTNIQTGKGESQEVRQTFADGEKLLIGN